MDSPHSDRRTVLKAGAAATAAALLPTAVHAAGNETIKVGVIGCGGRGSGVAGDILAADATLGGKTVGRLGGVAEHPRLGPIALASVRTEVGEGAELGVGGVGATVSSLPFGG